jgi:hypothetical protein
VKSGFKVGVGEIRGRTNRAFNLNFFVTDAPKTDPAVPKKHSATLATMA